MTVVSFDDYEIPPRFDNIAWNQARINESANETGPWNIIDTVLIDAGPDPAHPIDVSFSTDKGTLDDGGWYIVDLLDASGNELTGDAQFKGPQSATEILCSVDDINARLDGTVVEADAQNTALVQVSINRVVKAYLSRVIDFATLATWTTPETTPDTIREAASYLVAAQVYHSATAKSSTVIEPTHYARWLYNEGMLLLDGVIMGDIVLPPPTEVNAIEELTTADYFPIDDTDRAFTMGMNL